MGVTPVGRVAGVRDAGEALASIAAPPEGGALDTGGAASEMRSDAGGADTGSGVAVATDAGLWLGGGAETAPGSVAATALTGATLARGSSEDEERGAIEDEGGAFDTRCAISFSEPRGRAEVGGKEAGGDETE